MIEQIVRLRRKGLSFRKIAKELNSTVGKVQYQWTKHMKNKSFDHDFESTVFVETGSSPAVQPLRPLRKAPSAFGKEDDLAAWLISLDKIYVCWRLSSFRRELAALYFQLPFADFILALRLYDVTSILFNGKNAHHFHEIILPEERNNWFIKGVQPNRSYCLDLGIKRTDTQFFPLLRSNAIHVPRTQVNQAGQLSDDLQSFQNKQNTPPRWVEHVSTYSYYEKINRMEESK